MENNLQNKLKEKVMRGVYLEYGKNWALQNLPYILPIILFLSLFMLVSVSDIISNLSQISLASIFNFILVAMRDTEVAVQIIFGAFLLSLVAPIVRSAFSIAVSKSTPLMRAS